MANREPLLPARQPQLPPERQRRFHVVSSLETGASRGALRGVRDVWATLRKSPEDAERLTTGGYMPLGFYCEDYIHERSNIDPDAQHSINATRMDMQVQHVNAEVPALVQRFRLQELPDEGHRVRREPKDRANAAGCQALVAFRSLEVDEATDRLVNLAVFGVDAWIWPGGEGGGRAGGAVLSNTMEEKVGWPSAHVKQKRSEGCSLFAEGASYQVLEACELEPGQRLGSESAFSESSSRQVWLQTSLERLRSQTWNSRKAQRTAAVFTLTANLKLDHAHTRTLADLLRSLSDPGEQLKVMICGAKTSLQPDIEDRVRVIVGDAFFQLLRKDVQPWQLVGLAEGHPDRAVEGTQLRCYGNFTGRKIQSRYNGLILRKEYPDDPDHRRFFPDWMHCVEACMPVFRRRLLVNFGVYVGLFLLGLGLCRCDPDRGALPVPFWLWGPLALGAAIWQICDECEVVKHYAVPFVQEVGAFRACSFRFGFTGWLAWGLLNSIFDYIGTMSYTIVTATWVSRMGACMQTDSLTDSLWVEDFSHSMFSKLFGIVPLGLFAVFVWGATFVRLVHMLVSYWPWSMEAPNGDVKRAKYFNVLGTRVDRVEYFQFIAEQAGMDTVAQTVVEYRKARAVANIRKIERELADDPRVQGEWPFVLGDTFICMFHITMRNVLNKLVKCISTGLQITLLSIELASIHNTQYIGPLLSIIFAMLAFGPAYISVIELEVLLCKKIWPLAHQADFTENGETKMRGLLDKNGRDLRKVIYLFRGAWLTFALFGLFLALKLVMTFWCSSNLWNLDFPLSDGCV